MRKTLLLSLFLFLFFVPASRADSNSVEKLLRGITNIITAPIEIPKQARVYWIEGAQKTDHILVWVGCGSVWGIVQGVKRVGSGVWDIASFPFAKPNGYKPLLEPEYVFQEWPSDPQVFIFKREI